MNVVSSSKTKLSLSSLVFLFFFMTNLKLTGFFVLRENTKSDDLIKKQNTQIPWLKSKVLVLWFSLSCLFFVLLVFHQTPCFFFDLLRFAFLFIKSSKNGQFRFLWNMGRTLYFRRMVASPLGKRLQADHSRCTIQDSRLSENLLNPTPWIQS